MILDMLSEDIATSYNTVGSLSPLYFSIREAFTLLLKHIKSNFEDLEFIKVRNVSSAIKQLEANKQATNYYINYFDKHVDQERLYFIQDNIKKEELFYEFVIDFIQSKESDTYIKTNKQDVLNLIKDLKDKKLVRNELIALLDQNKQMFNSYEEFKETLIKNTIATADVLTQIYNDRLDLLMKNVEQLSRDNGTLVKFSTESIKAIMGLIYIQRFESDEFKNNFKQSFETFIVEQIEFDVQYKHYKNSTVDENIRKIIKNPSLSKEEKKNRLSQLFGSSFKKLTQEQQRSVEYAINLSEFLKTNYFDNTRWYDTFKVADTICGI
jgi:hypothetical protein